MALEEEEVEFFLKIGGGGQLPPRFNFDFFIYKNMMGNFRESGGNLPQNSYKPSRTYEKLPCKGEPYQVSG